MANTSPHGGTPESIDRLIIASGGPLESPSDGLKAVASAAFAASFLTGECDEFGKRKGIEGRRRIVFKSGGPEIQKGTSVTPIAKKKNEDKESEPKQKQKKSKVSDANESGNEGKENEDTEEEADSIEGEEQADGSFVKNCLKRPAAKVSKIHKRPAAAVDDEEDPCDSDVEEPKAKVAKTKAKNAKAAKAKAAAAVDDEEAEDDSEVQ